MAKEQIVEGLSELIMQRIAESEELTAGSDEAKKSDEELVKLIQVLNDDDKTNVEWTIQSQRLEDSLKIEQNKIVMERDKLEWEKKKHIDDIQNRRIEQFLDGAKIGVSVISIAVGIWGFCKGMQFEGEDFKMMTSTGGKKAQNNILSKIF